MNLKSLSLLALPIVLLSCGGNQGKPVDDEPQKQATIADSIAGDWVKAVDAPTGELSDTMGVTLKSDGSAQSINMPSYQYRKWKALKNDTIVLNAVSSVDGVVDSTICDTGVVDLGKGTITLYGGDIVYHRK